MVFGMPENFDKEPRRSRTSGSPAVAAGSLRSDETRIAPARLEMRLRDVMQRRFIAAITATLLLVIVMVRPTPNSSSSLDSKNRGPLPQGTPTLDAENARLSKLTAGLQSKVGEFKTSYQISPPRLSLLEPEVSAAEKDVAARERAVAAREASLAALQLELIQQLEQNLAARKNQVAARERAEAAKEASQAALQLELIKISKALQLEASQAALQLEKEEERQQNQTQFQNKESHEEEKSHSDGIVTDPRTSLTLTMKTSLDNDQAIQNKEQNKEEEEGGEGLFSC